MTIREINNLATFITIPFPSTVAVDTPTLTDGEVVPCLRIIDVGQTNNITVSRILLEITNVSQKTHVIQFNRELFN